MMPMRMRSLAPRTPRGEARVVAMPDAMVPIKLRREFMRPRSLGGLPAHLSYRAAEGKNGRRRPPAHANRRERYADAALHLAYVLSTGLMKGMTRKPFAQALATKQVPHRLAIWPGEAHRARDWRAMTPYCL